MATDWTGKVVGRTFVIAIAGHNKHGQRLWKCQCRVCGKEQTKVVPSRVRERKTWSCGCSRADETRARFTTHGLISSNKRLYTVWAGMKARCSNPSHKNFHSYGGRGVKVCRRWEDFALFFKDMGATYKPGLQLERKNLLLGYSPRNVCWATAAQQALNKNDSTFITIGGVRKHIVGWAAQTGLHVETIRGRIKRGYSGAALISLTRLPRRTFLRL